MKKFNKYTFGALALATGVLSANHYAKAQGAAFTMGDLVVEQIGNGSAALTSAATPVFVDEINPVTDTQVQSIALSTGTTNGTSFTDSGTATSAGFLSLSADKSTIVIPGYADIAGTASVTSASGVARAIGTISASGTVNTSTQFTDGYVANNIRGVSSPDGKTFFTTGNGTPTSSAGVRTYQLGATSGSSVSITPQTNTRVTGIFNGGLYYDTGSGTTTTYGIYQVNTNLSTASGQTATLFVNTTSNPYGFSISPDGKTAYVADSTLGIEKYTSTTGAAGSFTLVGTFSTAGTTATDILGRGLTVNYNSIGGPTLYFTNTGSGSSTSLSTLSEFTDAGTSFTVVPTLVETAATNEVFSGVDFAPSVGVVPEPTTVLGGTLLIGVAGWSQRRRLLAALRLA